MLYQSFFMRFSRQLHSFNRKGSRNLKEENPEISIIVNPYASGNPFRRTRSLVKSLKRENLQYGLFNLSRASLSEETINSLRESSIIIIVGGDGTLGGVIDSLLKADEENIIFGTFPAGTGNDMAKYLETTNVGFLMQALKSNRQLLIDVFSVTIHHVGGKRIKRYFIANLLIGHFGLALKETSTLGKSLFGKTAYFIGILLAIFRYKNFRSRIYREGECVYEGKNLAIFAGNVATACGGIPLAPHSSPLDGQLDLLVAESLPRLATLHALPIVFQGEHLDISPVHFFTGKQFNMQLGTPHIGIDGEYVGKIKRLEIVHETTIPFLTNKECNQIR